MALKGIDVSRWQGVINWGNVKTDFAILKATQGTAWVDPQFKRNKEEARKVTLVGYYHFADGTDAVKEAQHFVKTVGDLKPGELMALDWEIQHANPVTWCLAFLKEVERLVGFKPMLYTNSARLYAHDWTPVINNNTGLWVAQYGLNICVVTGSPRINKWPFYALWQYCSRGSVPGISTNVDMNYTSMDLETLKKYGYPGGEDPRAIYPIDKVYVTQEFGDNPLIYKRFGLDGHNGIDFRTRFVDSPLGHRYVVAAMDGTVTELGNEGSGGYGIFVRLQHVGNEQTVYGHLKKWYVTKGQKVKQGDRIALTDNTGFSTGPHLHFGWRPENFNYNNGYKGYDDPRKILPA